MLIWLLIPLRQYRSRFFIFFLFPAIAIIAVQTLHLFMARVNSSFIHFTCLTLSALSIIEINKHKTVSWAGFLTLFYTLTTLLFLRYSSEWRLLLLGGGFVAGFISFEVSKFIIKEYSLNRTFNPFHIILFVYFSNHFFSKMIFSFVADTSLLAVFSFITIFTSIISGFCFILLRENNRFVFNI